MDNDLIKAIGKSLVIMWNYNPNFRECLDVCNNGLDGNTSNYISDLMTDLECELSDEINEEIKQRHYNFGYDGEPFRI